MTNKDIIEELDSEVQRFYKIWQDHKDKAIVEGEWHSMSFAKIKRASMDLKQELTKVTQSSIYKYGRLRE